MAATAASSAAESAAKTGVSATAQGAPGPIVVGTDTGAVAIARSTAQSAGTACPARGDIAGGEEIAAVAAILSFDGEGSIDQHLPGAFDDDISPRRDGDRGINADRGTLIGAAGGKRDGGTGP
ncbi:MAG TPA: hypothetical protein DCY86_01670 [Bdellovibrionales bacterium]|nr:hypothetical protein [Bdellovibrionales bacterium]